MPNARAIGENAVAAAPPPLGMEAVVRLSEPDTFEADPDVALLGGRKVVTGVEFDGCKGVGAGSACMLPSALPVHESRCSLMRWMSTLAPQQGQSAKREPPDALSAGRERLLADDMAAALNTSLLRARRRPCGVTCTTQSTDNRASRFRGLRCFCVETVGLQWTVADLIVPDRSGRGS